MDKQHERGISSPPEKTSQKQQPENKTSHSTLQHSATQQSVAQHIIHHAVKNTVLQTVKKPREAIPGPDGKLRDSLGRIRYLHKYEHGQPDEDISEAELEEKLKTGKFVHGVRDRSYLVITFRIGSRKTEALEILKEDIREDAGCLYVTIPAKKHGHRGGEVELPLSMPGMDLVKEQWLKTHKGRHVWEFSAWTAWRIVKRVWPEKSPHHLRWVRVTKLRELRDQGKVTTDDIKSWTGIKRDSTIEGYGLKTQAGIHKISGLLSENRKPLIAGPGE
jgi:hypothetical protein